MNGAQILHFKSSLVEEAVNELINMLLDVDVPPEEESEIVSHKNISSNSDTSGEREDNKRVCSIFFLFKIFTEN